MNGRRTWLAAPAAALLLVGISATPAMASNILEIGQRATLVARGVAVDVPVTYTCFTTPEAYPPYSSVRVTQVVRGQQVAAAMGGLSVVCDGTSRTTTFRVTVGAGEVPFKSGTALVDADLITFDEFGYYDSVVVSQEVRIGR